jgi:hypothetical protein
VKEVIKQYLLGLEDLEIIRRKFLHYMRTKQEKSARTYASVLKDYKGIQVKLLQTLASLGVETSEEDLAKLLSDLPDVTCDVQHCACAYHQSIKKILGPVDEK